MTHLAPTMQNCRATAENTERRRRSNRAPGKKKGKKTTTTTRTTATLLLAHTHSHTHQRHTVEESHSRCVFPLLSAESLDLCLVRLSTTPVFRCDSGCPLRQRHLSSTEKCHDHARRRRPSRTMGYIQNCSWSGYTGSSE